jgi:NTE family protein
VSPRFGLACAGGVVEGAFYEIGVLCALDEAIEGLDLNAIDVYVGVSAGSILTACLANGIRPLDVARAMLSVEASPDALPPESLFVPAVGTYVRQAATVPARTLRALARYLTSPGDISLFGALLELATTLPVGLFDNRPLERHLARVFAAEGRTNDFRELSGKLRIMAVNLDTAELVAFGEAGTEHVAISRAVQASTALPLIYVPVSIDGAYYIDGVARRTLNASQALKEGVDLLFCVNPIVPIDLRLATGDGPGHRTLMESGLPAVLSQTFRTIIHSRMITGFRNYAFVYPDADLILIEPDMGDHSMFYSNIFSFENRHDVMHHGYETTRGYLLRNATELDPVLGRHGLRLRRSALRGKGRLAVERWGKRGSAEEVLGRTRRTLDDLGRALDRLAAAGG